MSEHGRIVTIEKEGGSWEDGGQFETTGSPYVDNCSWYTWSWITHTRSICKRNFCIWRLIFYFGPNDDLVLDCLSCFDIVFSILLTFISFCSPFFLLGICKFLGWFQFSEFSSFALIGTVILLVVICTYSLIRISSLLISSGKTPAITCSVSDWLAISICLDLSAFLLYLDLWLPMFRF